MEKLKPKALTKIIVKEISTKKVLMELKPTKSNETRASYLAAMEDLEVIRVYE